jgi:hypothetical protein
VADARGRDAAMALLSDRLDPGPGYRVVHASADTIGPRLHLSYRVSVDTGNGTQVMEQQAYCDVGADDISSVALLCSGGVLLSIP